MADLGHACHRCEQHYYLWTKPHKVEVETELDKVFSLIFNQLDKMFSLML